MRERSKLVLKAACLVLAGLLAWQLALVGIRLNPLAHVTIPELPSLPHEAANPSGPQPPIAHPAPGPAGKSTNNAATASRTNVAPSALMAGTNATASNTLAKVETNSAPPPTLAGGETNVTSPLPANPQATNPIPAFGTMPPATNAPTSITGTNTASRRNSATNGVASAGPGAGMPPGNRRPNARPMMGMPNAPSLPPAIQARVNRIIESEILGPVMHPQPMGLLGIAGDFAFLRAPSGQTGLVKLGDELGGIKLLRIGTNRVLVEEQGQPKELTIFSGAGGESLLPKQETLHETNN